MIKTVSLGLARELKVNNYPQESEFDWWYNAATKWYLGLRVANSWHNCPSPSNKNNTEWCAAPLAEEIIERLPHGMSIYKSRSVSHLGEATYSYRLGYDDIQPIDNISLAEAAGLMWLCLKEKGLLHQAEIIAKAECQRAGLTEKGTE